MAIHSLASKRRRRNELRVEQAVPAGGTRTSDRYRESFNERMKDFRERAKQVSNDESRRKPRLS